MSIIGWIILGLIAGWLAARIVGASGQGFFLDLALGIVGALVGGFLYSLLFGGAGITGLNLGSILVAVIGSVIVLLIYHALTGRRSL